MQYVNEMRGKPRIANVASACTFAFTYLAVLVAENKYSY